VLKIINFLWYVIMKEDYLVKNLVEKIGNLLPFDTEDISLEFKESLKPLIESSFQKLKIITKEEFELQLVRLERLEKRVGMLEVDLNKVNKL